MMEQGLVDEVKRLKEMGCTRDMVAMQGLGYKEILDYLDGRISLEEAVYIIKRDTRHFAKRQLTWFKRERDVRFIAVDDKTCPVETSERNAGQPGRRPEENFRIHLQGLLWRKKRTWN